MNVNIYVHIGFHKTGTSWLQEKYFSQGKVFNVLNNYKTPWNDEIIYYLIKCPNHLFKADHLRSLIQKKINLKKINIISAERLSGHPISGGFDSKKIAHRIKKTIPNAKIIITSREINSFIKSTYKQVVKEGYIGSLKNYLSFDHWKTCGPEFDYFIQTPLINEYKDIFDKKNILILSFEDFQINKDKFINTLNNYLGLKNPPTVSNEFSKIVGEQFPNRRLRALLKLNKFRKSDYNKFPLIFFSERIILILSKYFSLFFSNEEFVIEENLSKKLSFNLSQSDKRIK